MKTPGCKEQQTGKNWKMTLKAIKYQNDFCSVNTWLGITLPEAEVNRLWDFLFLWVRICTLPTQTFGASEKRERNCFVPIVSLKIISE